MASPRASGTLVTAWNRLWAQLFRPVDNASLVFARIAIGLLIALEAYRFLYSGQVWLKYAGPRYLIGWPGFDWVKLWPGDGIYWHFYALVVLGIGMAVGLCFRLAAWLLCIAITYVFLVGQAAYQNHWYLICLLPGLLALTPAHASFSVDARLRPSLRAATTPAWAPWILRIQLGVVYFYGGVAKLNWDWLQGYPMRIWLPSIGHLPLLGPIFEHAWLAVLMSWGGLVLDLSAVPLLLWRRTRPFAFAGLVLFHLWNDRLFSIGVFPWLAICCTTIFFGYGWPRRIFRWPGSAPTEESPAAPSWTPRRRALAGFLTAYVAVQVLVPLRHHFYPEDAHWTYEGHQFSWRMMLRRQRGFASYVLTDPMTEESWWVDPLEDVGAYQNRKLARNPSMLHLYARRLSELASEAGRPPVRVRAIVLSSLNGRDPAPLVDPRVDLAAQPFTWFGHDRWILPHPGTPPGAFLAREPEEEYEEPDPN